jgi:hypothetical protein
VRDLVVKGWQLDLKLKDGQAQNCVVTLAGTQPYLTLKVPASPPPAAFSEEL